MNKYLIKSIGAVIAGMITVVVLSVATDTLLESLGIFPPPTAGIFEPKLLIIALIYRTVYAVCGGWVTAALAPKQPMKLVNILLVIGTIMGLVGVIAGWNLSQHWYPIVLVITSAVGVWYGGKIRCSHPGKK